MAGDGATLSFFKSVSPGTFEFELDELCMDR